MIHREWPEAVAIRPSKLIAIFKCTKGRPEVMYRMNASFNCRASASAIPTSTRMPARRSASKPRPHTRGFGSSMEATTRAMPARMMASVHGGVRP